MLFKSLKMLKKILQYYHKLCNIKTGIESIRCRPLNRGQKTVNLNKGLVFLPGEMLSDLRVSSLEVKQ